MPHDGPRSGWKCWKSGSLANPHFHAPAENHFQPARLQMPKPRQTAISRCPTPISTHEHERRQRHRHSRRPEPHARPAPTRRSPHPAGNIGWTRSTTSRRTRIFQPMKPRRSGSSSPRRKGRLPGSWRRPPSVPEIGTAQAKEASGHAIRRRSRQGRVFTPASARPRRPCEPPTTPVSSDFPFYHAGTGRLGMGPVLRLQCRRRDRCSPSMIKSISCVASCGAVS
jgi:hypothetical protein